MTKLVYTFGAGQAEGSALSASDQKAILGGKGQGLAEMNRLGVPVPPGFTITTAVCSHYYEHGKTYPAELDALVRAAVTSVEKTFGSGARFGDPKNPLLLSVRSGARVSMPGMMDTVLNLGLNDAAAEALATLTGSPRFAYDSYRRFVQMYGDVVLDLKPETKEEQDPFEVILEQKKEARGVRLDTELSAEDLKDLVRRLQGRGEEAQGHRLPRRPLAAAVGRDRRGVRLVGQPPRRHLPRDVQHPRRLGHRGHRAGHGVRQPGRGLRHRRGVHARSLDRRAAVLR